MNLFIYVLLVSIWTNSCLNTNHSNGSSTTGAKHTESMEIRLDSFRRRLLIIIIGVMITAFTFTCFCFLHYNCVGDEAETAKKEGIAVKTSKSSKISINESKTASPCTLETESMLLNVEKSSEPSSPEKTSTLSSTEKLIKPSSPEMPSRPSSTEKLIRPSSQEMPSSHLEKSHRTCSLENSHKLTCSHKLVNQVSSSYSNMAVKSPWPASLQYPVKPTELSCPPCPHNQILVPTSSSLQKFGTRMSFGHSNVKTLVSVGRAEVLSSPQSVKSCQCYQEKCLMCNTSKSLSSDISKPKKTNAQNPPFLCEMKPFSKSFHRVDSRDNVVYGNASDSDEITYDSEDDSDREIIIICNRKPNEGTPNN
ncbi:uncharacterized protein CXorf66 homolog [Pteropus vampyrus]|uniref:Uncharacterized protein CXorf66 homolog n=1 Tax=Pteropus vampyrus TaxID=132908 RepID=A0A6P3R6B1_PTEVA|nr:uncharacterized protein CXorf66 homolog [Pteropus vampyrus]